jgi:hypothetical protein
MYSRSAALILGLTLVAQAQTDPSRALWLAVKHALADAGGKAYFESSIKDAALPGGVNGVRAFKGTVISSEPAGQPTSLVVVAISEETHPEATLRLSAALKEPVPRGTPVQFVGVAREFSPDPFMVTFDVDADGFEILAKEQNAADTLLTLAAGAPPLQLAPSGILDLRQAIPGEWQSVFRSASEFAVRGDTLCGIILASSPNGRTLRGVVCADSGGRRKASWWLPEAAATRAMEISDDGEVYILQERAGTQGSARWLLTYAAEGRLVSERQVQENLVNICWTGRTLAGITERGLIFDLNPRRTIPFPGFQASLSVQPKAVAIGENLVALADSSAARIIGVLLSTGAKTDFRLDMTAISTALGDSSVQVSAAASSAAGDLFLTLGSGSALKGLPVLHIDSQGAVRILRLLPPVNTSVNSRVPRIRANEARIYVLDAKGAIGWYRFK